MSFIERNAQSFFGPQGRQVSAVGALPFAERNAYNPSKPKNYAPAALRGLGGLRTIGTPDAPWVQTNLADGEIHCVFNLSDVGRGPITCYFTVWTEVDTGGPYWGVISVGPETGTPTFIQQFPTWASQPDVGYDPDWYRTTGMVTLPANGDVGVGGIEATFILPNAPTISVGAVISYYSTAPI